MNDHGAPRVLVVGAGAHSLGAALVTELTMGSYAFGEVVTAGLGEEQHPLDVRHGSMVRDVLRTVCPDIVLCTVGINEPASITTTMLGMLMEQSFHVNTLGVLLMLHHFIDSPPSGQWRGSPAKKFVAISSNSARIPRRRSLAYCASKAALSMGLRVAARELAGTGMCVWGYEPGLLAGTPMTDAVATTYDGPLHRMPGVGVNGLAVGPLAATIVADVANAGAGYHGVLFSYDAGEQ
jgi:NAD(P)-dependent dehydrogenase (short-subunit alcohol dehydrogenase family)